MTPLLVSIASIYFFVLIGFLLKTFHKEIDDRSITILSIYGLQPLLAFWGLMQRPIDGSFLEVQYLFLTILIIALVFIYGIIRLGSFDLKERSILMAMPIIGNTGNLGIPLGIMIFGEESAFFTNAINLINVFLVYTFGVFYYSRGNYSVKESIKNIAKIPVIWIAMLAIVLNLSGVQLSHEIDNSLKMGAYASMIIQLVLFGIFLRSVSIRSINLKLTAHITFAKTIIVPAVALVVLHFSGASYYLQAIVFLEVLVPAALTNANLATLYDCKSHEVVSQILISSVLFIFIALFAYLFVFDVTRFSLH